MSSERHYRRTSSERARTAAKKLNADIHLKHTHKQPPSITFPFDTKRVFADISHKVEVPSPDRYFKEDHLKINKSSEAEYGIAFNATNNSQFKKQSA